MLILHPRSEPAAGPQPGDVPELVAELPLAALSRPEANRAVALCLEDLAACMKV